MQCLTILSFVSFAGGSCEAWTCSQMWRIFLTALKEPVGDSNSWPLAPQGDTSTTELSLYNCYLLTPRRSPAVTNSLAMHLSGAVPRKKRRDRRVGIPKCSFSRKPEKEIRIANDSEDR